MRFIPCFSRASLRSLTLGAATVVCSHAGICQSGPHLVPNTQEVVNPLPIPVEVLVLHVSPKGAVDGHQVLKVDAKGTAQMSLPKDSTLANTMMLDPSLPYKHEPTCPAGARRMALSNSKTREEVAIMRNASEKGMAELEAANQKVASIQTASAVDTMNTALSDPATAARYQLLKDSASSQADLNAIQTAQNTEMALDMVAGGLGAAMANGAVITAHSEQSQKEADSLQTLLTKNKKTLEDIEADYRNEQGAVSAQREFANVGAGAIPSVPEVDLPGRVAIDRLCSGAANTKDMLQLNLSAAPEIKTVIGRAHFDHGGEEELVFHRINDSTEWVAIIYWPLEAGKAQVSLRARGGWQKVGNLQPGRDSVERQVADAKKSIGTLKKAHRQAAYAGEGGDENRTVILP